MYPGQDLVEQLTELLEKVDFNENSKIEIEELMKAAGKTTEKAAYIFPGVVIKEWTPPETENEEINKNFVSYVSSVGAGQFKIKLSEAIMLPLSYK